ncbi:MAG: NADH-quinone oxidoreductase subunit J [Candidatus Sumerlaea chitinivorans]|nr:NADH-quinone oxidoreductase subunit J [Candidatus Sumerlaea chitinivorans]
MTAQIVFYVAAALSVICTALVVMARYAVNAVLYLLLSLFGVALMFHTLGGPFVALLEIIVYAGAIVVLFLFVIMILNVTAKLPTPDLVPPSRPHLLVPLAFALILFIDTAVCIYAGAAASVSNRVITPADIGRALYQQHYLGVELASLVLLIGLIGGMHLAQAISIPDAKERKLHDRR